MSNEPVAPPRQGFNKLGRVGGVAECVPHFLDGCVQAVFEIDEGIRFPKPLAQVVTRDKFARPLEQRDEDLSWLLLKRDPSAVAEQLAGRLIQLESSKSNAGAS